MFGDLMEKDRAKRDEDKVNEVRRTKNPDLEDGEIASDREERRAARDPYRDDRREERREERRDERREEPKRRNYYEDGDRLNFYRHRRPESNNNNNNSNNNRGVPLRHSSWQSRSPPTRHSPY